MPYGLISMHEEMKLFLRILNFYSKLYPNVKFTKEEKIIEPKEIGEIFYTYAGEEIESFAVEKMKWIEDAFPEYIVPCVLLKKGKRFLLLDGHRRLRFAWKKGISWKALVISANKKMKFGIEDTIMQKIKEMY